MRAPAARWASVRGVVLSDTGTPADDGRRSGNDRRSIAPAVPWPERFRTGLRPPLLLRRTVQTSGPAALSSVHQLARSFCLSVSGAVAPSAPDSPPCLGGRPASPARVGANLGKPASRVKP